MNLAKVRQFYVTDSGQIYLVTCGAYVSLGTASTPKGADIIQVVLGLR